jgi:hypothetical protein
MGPQMGIASSFRSRGLLRVGAVIVTCGAFAGGWAGAAEEPPSPPDVLYESIAPAGVIVDPDAVPVAIPASGAEPFAVRPVTLVDESRTAAEKGKDKDKDKDARTPCREEDKACREALEALRDDDIASIALDIRVSGKPGSDYPCECRLEGDSFQPRRFATTMMTWKAAGYCHKPLYFEDWNLERYGHSHGPLDPVFSAAHFFVTLPVLPYKMGVELPWECVYPLGYYRPGSCAPWTVPAIPISCRGLAVEAATVTGLVFLLP